MSEDTEFTPWLRGWFNRFQIYRVFKYEKNHHNKNLLPFPRVAPGFRSCKIIQHRKSGGLHVQVIPKKIPAIICACFIFKTYLN